MNTGTSVGYVIQVTNPSGSPEVYNSPTGLEQWREGLPIPQADSVQITATIAEGDEPIKQMEGVLDGKSLPSVTVAPWTETLAAGSLALGDHSLQIVTSLSDKHNAKAKFPVSFTVVKSLPPDLQSPTASAPAPSSPVSTQVQGITQVLNNTGVESVDPIAASIVPPALGSSAKQMAVLGATVSFSDPNASAQRMLNETVDVNGSLAAVIGTAPSSPVNQFVFAIYRDGELVYASAKVQPIAGSRILLQAMTSTSGGLKPGPVQLYVWGVTPTGDYAPPTVVKFSINESQAASQSKS